MPPNDDGLAMSDDPPIQKQLECILEAFIDRGVENSQCYTWAVELLEALRSNKIAVVPF